MQLLENHIDVWFLSLDTKEAILDKLRIILSEDEIEKAQCLFSAEQMKHFITSRGFLRLLLSRYLKVKPGEIEFQYNNNGKPALSGKYKKELCFNISHSHGTALYGIAMRRSIGVDVEKIRTNISYNKIANRQFSQSEINMIQKAPFDENIQTFFNIWTRKEALLKATGKGLLSPMSQFDVSKTPDEPVTFLKYLPTSEKNSDWNIYDLDIGSGFCGALAVKGKHNIINVYKISVKDFLS